MRKLPAALGTVAIILATFLFVSNSKNVSAATNHIVISQIEITGSSANDEFVELYNPTSSSVNLSKWKLTRKNSAGSEGNLVASLSGVMLPHSYFLIGS